MLSKVIGEGGSVAGNHARLPEQLTTDVGRHKIRLTRGILVHISAEKLSKANLLDEATTRPVMTVLDVALNHAKHASPVYKVVGQAVFQQGDQQVSISQTCDMWHGFRQSVVLTKSGPMLQCDFGVSTFLKPMDVVAFLEGEIQRSNKTRGSRLCDPKMAASITKAIKGRKVVSSHNRNTQREDGVQDQGSGRASGRGQIQ